VAEGVENLADFFAVRALGFDLVQGVFFAEPMTIEKLMQACGSDRAHASAPETAASGIELPDVAFQTLSEGEPR
jgi:predicted signal transduction protein with EAL and GGDEF domain